MSIPINERAEAVVLGFLLSVKNPQVKLHDQALTPEDFASDLNARIFTALRDQFSQGKARADTVALDRRLSKDREYKEAGAKEYLQNLISSHLGEYKAIEAAKLIKDLSRRRAIIQGLSEQVTRAHDQSESLDGIVSGVNATLAGLVDQTAAKRITTQKEAVAEAYNEVLELIDNRGGPLGIPTDLIGLNNATSGFYPGDYYILAARPGTGKTGLALSFTASIARLGIPVLFFSLEMPRKQLIHRMMASTFKIDACKFRGVFPFSHEEKALLESNAVDELYKLPVHYYDAANVTAGEFRTICHIEMERHGIGLVVVDYLGKMKPDRRGQQRHLEISEISEAMRTVSKELKLPVLALAQMNRNVENRNSEPQLSDLRESGSLEQDADTVMFLHEDKSLPDPPSGMKKIILKIAKNRHGPERQIKLMFNRAFLEFTEMKEHFAPAPREVAEHWEGGED